MLINTKFFSGKKKVYTQIIKGTKKLKCVILVLCEQLWDKGRSSVLD